MSSLIKLGVIGAGNHFSKNIAPLFLEGLIDNFELQIVHSRSRATEFAKLGFITTDCLQKIFKQDLEAIYISLPNSLHALAIEQSIKKKIHVICEKSLIIPGTMDLELFSNSFRIKEAFMYKHHPLTAAVSRHFKAAFVKDVSIDFSIPHLKDNDIRYDASLGGGALLDLGAYAISAMRYFFPRAELQKVSASRCGFDVDIRGTAVYICPMRNARITLNWAFGDEYKNQITWKSDVGTFRTSRFFSKNVTEPGYIFHVGGGGVLMEVERTQIENHFLNMFAAFFSDIRTSNFANSVEIQQQRDLQEIIKRSEVFEHLCLK